MTAETLETTLISTATLLEKELDNYLDLSERLAHSEIHLMNVKNEIILNLITGNGGMKGLGSNEKERQLYIDHELHDNIEYTGTVLTISKLKAQLYVSKEKVAMFQTLLKGEVRTTNEF